MHLVQQFNSTDFAAHSNLLPLYSALTRILLCYTWGKSFYEDHLRHHMVTFLSNGGLPFLKWLNSLTFLQCCNHRLANCAQWHDEI